jgi:hypothetical protein
VQVLNFIAITRELYYNRPSTLSNLQHVVVVLSNARCHEFLLKVEQESIKAQEAKAHIPTVFDH